MNVYVRELVSALAQAGVDCTVFTRTWREGLAPEVAVEPGFRVVHIDSGPFNLAKEALPDVVDVFADGVAARLDKEPADLITPNTGLRARGIAQARARHPLVKHVPPRSPA